MELRQHPSSPGALTIALCGVCGVVVMGGVGWACQLLLGTCETPYPRLFEKKIYGMRTSLPPASSPRHRVDIYLSIYKNLGPIACLFSWAGRAQTQCGARPAISAARRRSTRRPPAPSAGPSRASSAALASKFATVHQSSLPSKHGLLRRRLGSAPLRNLPPSSPLCIPAARRGRRASTSARRECAGDVEQSRLGVSCVPRHMQLVPNTLDLVIFFFCPSRQLIPVCVWCVFFFLCGALPPGAAHFAVRRKDGLPRGCSRTRRGRPAIRR